MNILLIAEYFVRVILFCYFFLEILFFILKTNSYIKPIFSLNLADFCILLILTHSLLSILTRARSLEKCTVFLRILYNLVWNRVIMSEKRPWTEE